MLILKNIVVWIVFWVYVCQQFLRFNGGTRKLRCSKCHRNMWEKLAHVVGSFKMTLVDGTQQVYCFTFSSLKRYLSGYYTVCGPLQRHPGHYMIHLLWRHVDFITFCPLKMNPQGHLTCIFALALVSGIFRYRLYKCPPLILRSLSHIVH